MTKQPRLILLSAPIGAGKTELVNALKPKYGLIESRCKDHLFTLTQNLFNLSEQEFFEIYEDRDTKETPLSIFSVPNEEAYELGRLLGKETLLISVAHNQRNGSPRTALSVRETLIFVSELICKPLFGKDYFGKCRAATLNGNSIYIDDSCFGTADEIKPAIAKLGMDNILLIRIKGRGDFDGDSRQYVPDGVVKNTVDVYNDGTLEDFIAKCDDVISEFVGG